MACCKSDPNHQRSKAFQIFMDNLLIVLIVIAVILGVVMGLLLRDVWSHEELNKIWYLEFPGRILLGMLKMMILPLIISSLVVGMSSISSSVSGRLGAGAVFYYMTTTLIAVVIGIVLVLTIEPGQNKKENLEEGGDAPEATTLDTLLDLVSQCFPDNLVQACFQRKTTHIGEKDFPRTNHTDNTTYYVTVEKRSLKAESGTNVLGIVVFSIALGSTINHLGDEGKALKDFFLSLNAATMVLINIIIWYTPIGICFLVAGKFVSTEDIEGTMSDLGLYFVTVVAGLAIHGFIALPLIFFVATRTNPFGFMKGMLKAIFTAWGTASSSATLPITMDCLINKNKVNINIVRFVAPVGATINMDGTALYEAVACIFIAQINDVDLSVADVIVVSLTATAAAIGAAGVPQAGLVTLVIVVTSVGLPAEDITFILAIDWFLDRFRTAINVWGDSCGCGILNHLFRDMLAKEIPDTGREFQFDIPAPTEPGQNLDKKDPELPLEDPQPSPDVSDDRPPSYHSHHNNGYVDDEGTRL